MWFRGVMLYVKKRMPEVTLTLEAVDDKIKLTGKFVDYEHRYRYADERVYSSSLKYTHGITFRLTSYSSTTNLTTSGMNRLNFGAYSDTGTFTYYLASGSSGYRTKTTKNYYRAWIYCTDPDTGRGVLIGSGVLGISYDALLETGPREI